MPDKSIILKALKEDSLELIEKLNTGFLSLEKDTSQKEVWEDVMRTLHNLKGLSRVMGFDGIGTLSHRMEDVVKIMFDSKTSFSSQKLNVFLKAVDTIDLFLKAAVNNQKADLDLDRFLSMLDAIAKGEPLDAVPSAASEVPSAPAAAPAAFVAPAPSAPVAAPSVSAVSAPSAIQDSVRIRTERLDYLLNIASEMVIGRICFNKELKDMEAIQDTIYREYQEWQSFYRKCKVDIFSIKNHKFNDLEKKLDKNIQNFSILKDQFVALFNNHSTTISHHNTIISDYQQKIMEVRMLPISIVLSTFPRLVHDLSQQFGKKIEFIVEGGEIEIDKKILEDIRDPLIHILRNAVDHGIESPEERKQNGKPETGRIKLVLSYQGSQIKIEFSDDGGGIDIEKIKQSAVKKGFYTEAEVKVLERDDLLNLIFRPGFSTSEIITSVSGRGVGMDVVQKNIKALGASLSISTVKNAGTKFTILIPLSMATTNILIVGVGDQLFAIPSLAVEQTLEIYSENIHTVEGREAISIGNHIIPLAWLDIVLGITKKGRRIKKHSKLSVVILSRDDKRIAFVVDKLVDEGESVIKSMGKKVQDIFNIIGVTILGSGELVFILDPLELIISARQKEIKGLAGEEHKKPQAMKQPCVLVTDDQMTIRQLHRSILESSGYRVEEARDGIEALDKLSKNKIDLVITDVQMPRMDGFELTGNIKTKDAFKNIPVIIVSSLASEEDKKKGIKLGADGYLTKQDFNQQNLTEIIKILLGRNS